jgi:probable HAF family extracellular repeat protein
MRTLSRFAVRSLCVLVLLFPAGGAIGGDLDIATSTHAVVAKPNDFQITITDLGLLPGGTFSSGLAINNQPLVIGLANDGNFTFQRPFWDANTGAIVGLAENANPASTAIPEHLNDSREMAGTEVYGDNVYQGIYWDSTGEAFVLPPLAGVDPFYGSLHTRAHGINNMGQMAGSGKEGEPDFLTHAALWADKDTLAMDLGFLGHGIPVDYSEAYGVNDLSHVVGIGAVGSAIHGFLWRNSQMIDLGSLDGQGASEAKAINNTGLIVGKSNIDPVVWKYDIADENSTPTITPLPMPPRFFTATPTAVNDAGDVAGYAGSPSIDAHAILWRNGVAIDLGVWPGGHYSVANGINNLGQIVGTGTVAGDNLDHALMWTVDDGGELMLSITGSCPGAATIGITGATPGGTVPLARGTPGSFIVPGGACAGTELGLASPRLLRTLTADGDGNINLNANLPPGACGVYLQALDLTTCDTSNVVRLPAAPRR